MALKFLTGIQIEGTPAAPGSVTTAIVGETIEISFGASSESVDQYQVWAAQGSGSYNLIAQLTPQDFASTMTVVDSVFTVGGTRNYRVYAVRAGVYSSPASASRTFTVPSLDVLNMRVNVMEEAFTVEWDAPASRFVDHYEVYHHAHASSGSLNRNNASLAYSGNNTMYIHSTSDEFYHQFWVEVVTV